MDEEREVKEFQKFPYGSKQKTGWKGGRAGKEKEYLKVFPFLWVEYHMGIEIFYEGNSCYIGFIYTGRIF